VHELLGFGMVILLGLLGGKLSHRFKIPRVTGYMLTGLLFGPSVIGLISSETLQNIYLINEIALGLILFAIGGEIEWRHMKAVGLRVVCIALIESMGAFVFVTGLTLLLTGDWVLAVLLGSISVATAPGVTLLIIREYHANGPLTETLLAVVAINNILCLVLFRFVFSIYSAVEGEPLLAIGFELIRELAASVLLGGIIAAVITFWEQKIDDLSELLLIIVSGLLIGIGVARELGISPLMVCLIVGAVTNNLSMMHRLVYAELRQTEMPFYIAFFVLSGASLHLDLLPHLGVIGVVYLFARPLGKAIGATLAAKRCRCKPEVISNLGITLLPQAGVAIGMVMVVSESYPELGQTIGAIVLSSIIVYEGIGPFLTRLALARAKEIFLQE